MTINFKVTEKMKTLVKKIDKGSTLLIITMKLIASFSKQGSGHQIVFIVDEPISDGAV